MSDRRAVCALVLASLAWLSALPAGAQERTVEVQVPFDSLRAVWEVGPDLRGKLGLAFYAVALGLYEDPRPGRRQPLGRVPVVARAGLHGG